MKRSCIVCGKDGKFYGDNRICIKCSDKLKDTGKRPNNKKPIKYNSTKPKLWDSDIEVIEMVVAVQSEFPYHTIGEVVSEVYFKIAQKRFLQNHYNKAS